MYNTFQKEWIIIVSSEQRSTILMLKISQTGWAPGSVRSDEQHLPQSKTNKKPTRQTKSFCLLLQSFHDGKKRAFFFLSTCFLWGIFFPRLVKCDDSFSIPGASTARGGKTTRRHYTKLNLIKLYSFFFFLLFSFFSSFLIVEVIERETKSSLGPSCSFLKVFTH